MDTEARGEADRFRTLHDANHDRVHRLLGRIAARLLVGRVTYELEGCVT